MSVLKIAKRYEEILKKAQDAPTFQQSGDILEPAIRAIDIMTIINAMPENVYEAAVGSAADILINSAGKVSFNSNNVVLKNYLDSAWKLKLQALVNKVIAGKTNDWSFEIKDWLKVG